MVPVSIRSVSKSYDGTHRVLDDLSLDVAAGEMFFLLGASGCGKTTLLRMIAGFLAADSGEIRFADRDVTSLPAERRGIGMVFQNYALWPHLDVAGNVGFGLDLRRVPEAEKRRRIDEALALVELGGFGARRIAELSGGQQQRVALARALVIRPEVLLLDEPLSNLDARLRAQMRVEIRRVCKAAGVTAIYVTHDQKEALSTADRIAVLVAGRLAQLGTPRELYERPASRAVAEFIGEANLLPGVVASVGAQAGSGTVSCALGTLATAALPEQLMAGAPVLLCLRPERIRLAAAGAAADAAAGTAFTGAIASQSYLGETAQWSVASGGVSLAVSEAAPPPRAVGDRVVCRVAPGDVVVLPP